MADLREKLMQALDAERPALPETLYDIGYNNGLTMAMAIVRNIIAHGVTVQEWIPVTERLPDNNERVLVYHDDGMIRFGINKGGFADVVSTLYLKHNNRTCFSKVTHWMPLPEPPKGE